MKNNKGFTLIELLAVVVILAILMSISIPIIFSLLDKSKSKMYVSDAKKLISKAEYKLRASSSHIEKPNEGDCIIISLRSLDSSTFDNPPNRGEYDRDSSFVLVKNINGNLEYSASIVEKFKGGGYKGVELSTYKELTSDSALSNVVSFKAGDLVTVNTIDKAYINSKLGEGYISSEGIISEIYDDVDIENKTD